MIRMLVVNDDRGFERTLTRAIDCHEDIQLAGSVHDGDGATSAMRACRPDLALINLSTLGSDGVPELIALREELCPRPRFLGVGDASDEEAVWDAVNRGLDYCVMRPLEMDTLLHRARQLVRHPLAGPLITPPPGQLGQLEAAAAKLLTHLGVPTYLKGYRYLVEAVAAVARQPDLVNSVTGRLYPLVAVRRQSTPRRVERAIRTSIEATWARGNWAALEELFAYQIDPQRGKPTNAAFIARVATELRLQRGLRVS